MAIQPDGKILTGGRNDGGGGSNFLLARYRADGSLDPTFDFDGMATLTQFSGFLNGIAVDGQNRVVAVGSNGSPLNAGTFVVARVMINASKLFDYSGDGKADLSVWRPSTNSWYIQTSIDYSIRQFGDADDKLAPADYDEDGKTESPCSDLRPATGNIS